MIDTAASPSTFPLTKIINGETYFTELAWKFQEERSKQLEQRLADAEEILGMVEDHRKMPHQHEDAQTKLYCLTERAAEYFEKHKRVNNE